MVGEKKRGKVAKVAHHITFAKALAGNDKRIRDKAVKNLKKYLAARSQGDTCFSEDDFMILWKGLFYCMWMSDKPLVQENLAEQISSGIHCLQSKELTLLFIKRFCITMGTEWFGIDQHRLEKFLMFVRRFLRQSLQFCANDNWNADTVSKLIEVFRSTVFAIDETAKCKEIGFITHFTSIFLQELAKVSKGKLSNETLLQFLQMFAEHLSVQDDGRIKKEIVNSIFKDLIKQSPLGIEYEERFRAWKRAGFPGKSCEDMVKIQETEEESEDEEETANKEQSSGASNGRNDESDIEEENDIADPRAGHVNVNLPLIHFDAPSISKMLHDCAGKSKLLRCRKTLQYLAKMFHDVSESKYPFKVYMPPPLTAGQQYELKESDYNEAVVRLEKLDDSFRNENEKKRKRKADDSDTRVSKKQKLKEDSTAITEELEDTNCVKVIDSEVEARALQQLNVLLDENKDKKTISPDKKQKNTSLDKCSPKIKITMNRNVVKNVNNGDQISNESSHILEQGNTLNTSASTDSNNDSNILELSVANTSATDMKRKKPVQANDKKENSFDGEDTKKKLRSNRKSITSVSSSWQVTNIPTQKLEVDKQQSDYKYLPLKSPRIELIKLKDTASPSILKTPNPQLSIPVKSPISPKNKVAGKKTPSPRKATLNSNKKVNIALQLNRSQGWSEYTEALKQSPSIPFDGRKKPLQGVLKQSGMQSPLNPFYKPPKGIRNLINP